eukprot:scaffold12027_cov104-Isochrysis_galbana.AAC.7
MQHPVHCEWSSGVGAQSAIALLIEHHHKRDRHGLAPSGMVSVRGTLTGSQHTRMPHVTSDPTAHRPAAAIRQHRRSSGR